MRNGLLIPGTQAKERLFVVAVVVAVAVVVVAVVAAVILSFFGLLLLLLLFRLSFAQRKNGSQDWSSHAHLMLLL